MHTIFYEKLCNFISSLNNLLWGYGTVLFVFAAGIFFTIRVKGFTIIHMGKAFGSFFEKDKSVNKEDDTGKISRFQAISTALAASMGTGNIVGVAAAISAGGAGAIFWMWISALFGTSLAFAENVLGVKYRNRERSGPMAYISTVKGGRFTAAVYAVVCLLASFGIGNMTQTNALASAACEIGIPPAAAGAAAAIICGMTIFRGAKGTASAAEKLIPAVSALYFAASVIVIVIFRENLLDVLKLIFTSAFGIRQAAGGIIGASVKQAISVGLRRGVFSNEAGMGSSVLVHSETDCGDPVRAGMWAVAEVVIDTVICCTLTALVILVTGSESCGKEGLAMAAEGFRRGLGEYAGILVSLSAMIFAFCTLLGWYFYGEKCLAFTFRGKGKGAVLAIFRILYVIAAFVGSVSELTIIWGTADIFNWFMLMINLFALFILNDDVAESVKGL